MQTQIKTPSFKTALQLWEELQKEKVELAGSELDNLLKATEIKTSQSELAQMIAEIINPPKENADK